MELVVKRFEKLSNQELYDILRLRVNVFVVEQNCPYPELDGKDAAALHVFLRDEEGIAAYLRVLAPGVSYPEASLGRVISARRRQGLGSVVLREGIRLCWERFDASAIRIEAQTYARPFYAAQGFVQVSQEFLEDGIPHVEMLLQRPAE